MSHDPYSPALVVNGGIDIECGGGGIGMDVSNAAPVHCNGPMRVVMNGPGIGVRATVRVGDDQPTIGGIASGVAVGVITAAATKFSGLG